MSVLDDAAARAVRLGLAFLEATLGTDGSWPSRRYENHELVGSHAADRPPAPFAAAVGALSLDACDHPRAGALVGRTRRYILSRIEYPGVWRYWPTLPPDQDDTALCALAAPSHIWLMLGRNIDIILSYRDDAGRFLTWMAKEDPSGGARNDVDSVVNANVVARLGDCAETKGAQSWLESLVAEHREAGSSPWYVFPLDLHVALVRASHRAAPAFVRLRPTLVERMLSARDDDGCFGDIVRTAQAASALLSLGRGGEVRSSVERLIDAQGPHGGWPECLLWQGPSTRLPGGGTRRIGFASEALSTAICIETLSRFLRGR